MFFKPKKSKVCVMLRQKIIMEKRSLEQISYYTERYVVSQIMDKTTMYIATDNQQYMVDTNQQQLKAIDLSQQQMQINQLKAAIGMLQFQEKQTNAGRQLSITNDNDKNIRIKAELDIKSFPLLAKTCNQSYQNFSNSLQIYSVEIAPDEYVARSHTEFILNEQTKTTDVELVEIKEILDKIPEFDAYLKYKKTK